jgi:hypothetical protein
MSYQFRQNMSHNIVFGDNIGTLSFDNQKLSFTGNADESAKIMFNFVVAQFNSHIQKIRTDEREACAKLCESEGHRIDASWESCARAIRARGRK